MKHTLHADEVLVSGFDFNGAQLFAPGKGVAPESGDRGRYGESLNARAALERGLPEMRDVRRDGDLLQQLPVVKRHHPDRGESLRKLDATHLVAAREGFATHERQRGGRKPDCHWRTDH